MNGIACPHCTFINAPNKVKCGVCLRLLRKRERNVDNALDVAGREGQAETPSSSSFPLHEPSTRRDESESLAASGTQVRSDTTASPIQPAVTESCKGASNQVIQSHCLEAMPAASSLVSTLFSTASGKTVTVHQESLRKATERLGDVGTLDTTRVSTLFETASGKAVTVQKKSIEKAKASLDNPETESTSSVASPKPFCTPRGSTVRTPTVPLQSAAECLQAGSLYHEDETLTVDVVCNSEVPRPIQRVEASPVDLAASRSDRSLFVPAPGRMGERRRGFVPPKRHPTALVHAMPSSATPPVQTTGLKALRFDPDACTCRSVTPIPTLSSITSLMFSFTGSDCGRVLAGLLGAKEVETVRLGHWHFALLKLGASPMHCTMEWCRHALVSAMAQVHFMTMSPSGALSSAFTPLMVFLWMMHLYNTEMVSGERPALRKMVEGDISSASLVVLYLSSVCEERSSPHTRIVTLSDGIYHLRVTCDVPVSNLIREGVLRPGQRMAVCGAKLLLHGQCAPTECERQVVFSINYNCVRAVAQTTSLGVCHGEPLPLPLSLVHPLGGLVPAIEGVVARVLPSFFVSQEGIESPDTADGTRQTRDRSLKTVRSTHAQLQWSERLRTETGALAEGESPESRPVSRVTSLLLTKDGAEALVQQWETVDERALLVDDDGGGMSLPVEGSWVTLYAVNPAKARTAAAPFSRSKLFYASRKLHYVPSKKPLQHLRRVWQATTDHRCTTGVGDVADVCGLYMGSHKNDQGTFALLLLRGDTYALLQIPAPSVGRVLSFQIPATERVPLVLLNATFLTAEDSVAGSDCLRVLANEYTALLQRSTQSNLKDALETALQLRQVVEAAPQKYTSRRAEVFRSLDESGPNGGLGLQSSTFLYSSGPSSAPEVPLDTQSYAPLASQGAPAVSVTSSQREGKLPYYLRQGSGSGKAGRLQGVRLPSASFLAPAGISPVQHPHDISTTHTCVREPQPSPLPSIAAAGSRHYGNIVDLMFLCDPRLYRRAWHPFTDDPLQDSHTADVRQSDVCFTHAQLCWRLSADPADYITSRVEERGTLGAVLESVCPLQELCSVIADERQIDVSLARSERLVQWRRQDSPTVWWRFFADSRVLGAPADLEGASSEYLWWLPAEWAEAMRTVHTKLQGAFFFFSLKGEVVRHVRLISDSCNVTELPCN
ncbi:hypothetical protein JKF63_05877 [Porcisia hertigi]|uniref:BRCA2 OB1 domain-containing protein n=1 Tax=Porcisia hertigi TaxID=2761500 RepID=A0A836LC18_9TRYP|nr:hypothetical protein JKF63_05877 [Porcisia hertigi]